MFVRLWKHINIVGWSRTVWAKKNRYLKRPTELYRGNVHILTKTQVISTNFLTYNDLIPRKWQTKHYLRCNANHSKIRFFFLKNLHFCCASRALYDFTAPHRKSWSNSIIFFIIKNKHLHLTCTALHRKIKGNSNNFSLN